MGTFSNIKKKSGRGIRNISEESRDAIVSKAANKWRDMGLDDDEIAFGIATMGLESGFDPLAKASTSTAKGLGQFLDGTWKDAVRIYNKYYDGTLEHDASRDNTEDQILVIGAYIEKLIWPVAKKHAKDSRFNGYSIDEIAYGMWHEGAGTRGNIEKVSRYLNTPLGFNNSNIRGYFKITFNEARKALKTYFEQRNDAPYVLIQRPIENILFGMSADGIPMAMLGNSDFTGQKLKGIPMGITLLGKETLWRDGDRVYRIEEDGSTRGYFIST